MILQPRSTCTVGDPPAEIFDLWCHDMGIQQWPVTPEWSKASISPALWEICGESPWDSPRPGPSFVRKQSAEKWCQDLFQARMVSSAAESFGLCGSMLVCSSRTSVCDVVSWTVSWTCRFWIDGKWTDAWFFDPVTSFMGGSSGAARAVERPAGYTVCQPGTLTESNINAGNSAWGKQTVQNSTPWLLHLLSLILIFLGKILHQANFRMNREQFDTGI